MSKPLPANTDEVFLSSNFTVARYRQLEDLKDRQGISEFVHQRFLERYLLPVKGDQCDTYASQEAKSGFTMMAICCLMIEALESFHQGWPNTRKKKGANIFNSFFSRYQEFSPLQGHGAQFYSHVRCGIMHQAETTDGWLIRRDQLLMVDTVAKIIDANSFVKNLEACLDHYCDELISTDWDGLTWINFRAKMNGVIRNCRR